jgi:hypothetical protein
VADQHDLATRRSEEAPDAGSGGSGNESRSHSLKASASYEHHGTENELLHVSSSSSREPAQQETSEPLSERGVPATSSNVESSLVPLGAGQSKQVDTLEFKIASHIESNKGQEAPNVIRGLNWNLAKSSKYVKRLFE